MAEEARKRKRESNGVISPNKKLAALPQGTLKINHLQHTRPAIVQSKGLQVPTFPFKAYVRSTSQSQILLQTSAHPRLDYTAVPGNSSSAHYVAVFDPSESTLDVAPAYHAQLQAVLRSAPNADEQSPSKKNLSQQQQRIELGQEFGTKKAKKALASRTINAITNDDTGSKADELQTAILDDAAERAGEAADEAEQLEKLLKAKPIPMPKLEATTVEEVYPLDDLIPSRDMRYLDVKDWRSKARAGENIQLHHRFPAFRVQPVATSDDTRRLKALSYIALLLRFHDALRKGGRNGKSVPKKDILLEKLEGYPEALIDSIRKRFSSETNDLTKWQIEKLQTTICALTLFVDSWVSDTSALRDDLKLDNKTIQQFFTELGCKVRAMSEAEREKEKLTKAQAAMVRMAVLRLPLVFPKLRSGRRK